VRVSARETGRLLKTAFEPVERMVEDLDKPANLILSPGAQVVDDSALLRTFRSSPPGQNQGTGGDEESADSFASRQALVQKQDSKGHGHHHAELVDRCNL
jgi:hypothetical protein